MGVVCAPDPIGRTRQRAGQGNPAVADVVPHAVVEKSHDLESQLGMREALAGDDAAEVPRAGDQDALEADARPPAALERLAYELARRVRKGDVQGEEEQPDPLGNFVQADVLQRLGRVVGLVVERAAEAEDDGEDGADEHAKEVVHARAAAAQPVQPLNLEGDRPEQSDEGRNPQVLPERRYTLVHGQQAVEDFEAEQVGDEKRRQTEERVTDDEEQDEQPVVSPHHCSVSRTAGLPPPCWYLAASVRCSVSRTAGLSAPTRGVTITLRNCSWKRAFENDSAWRRMAAVSNSREDTSRRAAANASTEGP